MHISIKSKLLLGYGAVLAVVAGLAVIIYGFVHHLESMQSRIVELRQPTVIAGMNLNNGVNTTLAGLRGYIILGKDPEKAKLFRDARLAGWEAMDENIDKMSRFSKNWTDAGNTARLNELKTLIDEFRVAQDEIESIAQSEDNIPSLKIFNDQIKPAAYTSNDILKTLFDQAYQNSPGKNSLYALAKLKSSINRSQVGLLNYINSGTEADLEAFEDIWSENQKDYENARVLGFSSSRLWREFSQSRTVFRDISNSIIQERSSPDWNRANYWLGSKAAPRAGAIQNILKDMLASQNQLMNTDNRSLNDDIKATNSTLIIGMIVAMITGITIALWLSNKIVGNLNKILNRTKDIARGELTDEELNIHSNDELQELGEATTIMARNLSELIIQVKHTTHDLSSAANQLVESSGETNNCMVSQSNTGLQVTTSMEEMTSTVTNMAENTNQAAEATQTADDQAREGQRIMATNISSINQLAERIESAATTITSLESDTQGVDDIVQVINAIAEQTNLLALNAAIEAARAGDQGRGFAVVADEVRTLAGRTQESTEQINALLDKLKNGTQRAVRAMEDGQQQTRESVNSTQRTSDTLENITESVSTIHAMNSNIATAATEQHCVAESMSSSISDIQKESQQALRCTQETDSAAQLVGQHANNLNKLVSQFTLPQDKVG